MNGSGTIVVEYTYDAWGYIRNTTGTMAETLGKANALRYSGYIYDTETSLYYLQSRYYNPGTGRFINADALVATGQGLLGNNMFAYCLNNPVVLKDPNGYSCVLYYYSAFGESTVFLAVSEKKREKNWIENKNKRKGYQNRQPTGSRERNVKHPDGEEHSRIPKGNGRGVHRYIKVQMDNVDIIPVYGIDDSTYILDTREKLLNREYW